MLLGQKPFVESSLFKGSIVWAGQVTRSVIGKTFGQDDTALIKSRQLRNFANAVYRDWPTYETDFVEAGL